MIGEIRQNFTEASASVGLILATALLCHSGLIPLKTAYKKRGELLRAIASKRSAAFVTVFARNLVHAHKFRIFQKTA